MRHFAHSARKAEFRWWLFLTLLAVLLYVVWPRFDIWVAQWFYSPTEGFMANQWSWITTWHQSVGKVGRSLLVLALLAWPLGYFLKAVRLRRQAMSLSLVMILGLGLIVHTGFKDQWGRARPQEVVEFGGSSVYTSPLIPSHACPDNCSFVSGHAGTGYMLIGLGALSAARQRKRWLLIGWGAGSVLGFIRMAQGGHFFGDILFAGLILWGVGIMLRRTMLLWRKNRISRSHRKVA